MSEARRTTQQKKMQQLAQHLPAFERRIFAVTPENPSFTVDSHDVVTPNGWIHLCNAVRIGTIQTLHLIHMRTLEDTLVLALAEAIQNNPHVRVVSLTWFFPLTEPVVSLLAWKTLLAALLTAPNMQGMGVRYPPMPPGQMDALNVLSANLSDFAMRTQCETVRYALSNHHSFSLFLHAVSRNPNVVEINVPRTAMSQLSFLDAERIETIIFEPHEGSPVTTVADFESLVGWVQMRMRAPSPRPLRLIEIILENTSPLHLAYSADHDLLSQLSVPLTKFLCDEGAVFVPNVRRRSVFLVNQTCFCFQLRTQRGYDGSWIEVLRRDVGAMRDAQNQTANDLVEVLAQRPLTNPATGNTTLVGDVLAFGEPGPLSRVLQFLRHPVIRDA